MLSVSFKFYFLVSFFSFFPDFGKHNFEIGFHVSFICSHYTLKTKAVADRADRTVLRKINIFMYLLFPRDGKRWQTILFGVFLKIKLLTV